MLKNTLKKGDRVHCYDSACVLSKVYTIIDVIDDYVILDQMEEEYIDMTLWYGTCIRAPREFLIPIGYQEDFSSVDIPDDIKYNYIKVREVIDE